MPIKQKIKGGINFFNGFLIKEFFYHLCTVIVNTVKTIEAGYQELIIFYNMYISRTSSSKMRLILKIK